MLKSIEEALINSRTARFRDQSREDGFRQSQLPGDIANARTVIVITMGVLSYFATVDYRLFAGTHTLLTLWGARIAYLTISAWTRRHLTSLTNPAIFQRTLFVWVLGTVLFNFAIEITRPVDFSVSRSIDVLMVFLMYTVFPLGLEKKRVAGILFALSVSAVVIRTRASLGPVEMNTALVGTVMALIIGDLITRRAEIARRTQSYAIRSQQQALEDVRRSEAELAAGNEELDAFARTVAHDLKNPVAAVIGASKMLAETLGREPLNRAEAAELAQMIVESANTQDNIIRELLLLAQVRRAADVPTHEIDMNRRLSASLRRIEMLRRQHGATVDVLGPLPPAIGHGPWIEEVWVNYLSNAFKYGGNEPQVLCGAEVLEETVRYWVRDSGPGIPHGMREDVFTEYLRLQNTRAEGHGLGLSVVKRIVERCGGTVGVTDAPLRGAEFWFTLPAAPTTTQEVPQPV